MEWIETLGFEARFAMILGATAATAGVIAWLIRLPLGRRRDHVAALIVSQLIGVAAAFYLVLSCFPETMAIAGMRNGGLVILALTLALAALMYWRIRSSARNGWLAVVAIGATLLLGGAAVRLDSDRAAGDRNAGTLIIVHHVRDVFGRDRLWRPYTASLRKHFRDEAEGVIERYRSELLAAIAAGDKPALGAIDGRIASDLLDIPRRSSAAFANASDPALVRFMHARRALIDALADRPELCVAQFGVDAHHGLGGLAAQSPELGRRIVESETALAEAVADGRARAGAPPRMPLTDAELARLRVEIMMRTPAAAPSLRAQCDALRILLDTVLSRPDDFVARYAADTILLSDSKRAPSGA